MQSFKILVKDAIGRQSSLFSLAHVGEHEIYAGNHEVNGMKVVICGEVEAIGPYCEF